MSINFLAGLDRRAVLKNLAMATILASVVLVGGGVAADPVDKDAEGRIKAKDNKGREWLLQDWKDGTAKFPAPEVAARYKEWLKDVTRPYPKDFKEREAWYRKKHGEHWDGPVWGDRILSPGNWKWEAIPMPDDIVKVLWELGDRSKAAGGHRRLAGVWQVGCVYASGADVATDVYSTGGQAGMIHLDLKTKKFTVIGNPLEGGNKDGLGSAARLEGTSNWNLTIDLVTGRVFWRHPKEGHWSIGSLRYVEKLLPYNDKANGKEYLLPAFLDFKDMYKKVKSPAGGELEPVVKDGRRADPVFAVKTVKKLDGQRLNGPGGERGARPLVTHDGKAVYVEDGGTASYDVMRFDKIARCDLETGVRTPVPLKGVMPPATADKSSDATGSHGGICVGVEGFLYACQHGGCAGYPMQLVWFNPETGMPGVLYSSCSGKWGNARRGGGNGCSDGPADSQYLMGTSTKWQTQCPRTGAIMNGGWDGSGIRRYQDGFVTSVADSPGERHFPRPDWNEKDAPNTGGNTFMGGIAPNGDLYAPDGYIPRILRYYRTDWPKEQPEYGYGEKFMPKAKLEALMLEYAKKYIANYQANSTF